VPRLLVGCAGPAGSGKSVVAEHLRDRHGFTIVSLADPLKRVVGELFGFTEHQLYGPSYARSEPHPTLRKPDGQPLTARHALQTLGTDWARACCPNVWVERAMRTIRSMPGDVVVPDMRFTNEVDAIRAAGGVLVRRKLSVPVADPHPTERELLAMHDAEFSAVLPRTETLEQLYGQLDVLVSGWKSGLGR
jgi:hypothetical protein